MTDDTGEFRAEVRAALAGMGATEGAANPEDHPTIDELIAYRGGELAEAETDRLQEHLAHCRSCLDRLAELEGFVEAGKQGPSEVASLEEASAWRALEEHRTAPRHTAPGRNAALALAASFLVAAIGLGLWAMQQRIETAQLREQLAELSRPQPAIRVVDLFSEAHVRSGEGTEPTPVDLTAVEHLTVILHPPPEMPDFARYEAVIADPAGNERWRGRLYRDGFGDLVLGLPRPFVDARSHRIDLYGIGGDDRQHRRHLATFPLDLLRSGEE